MDTGFTNLGQLALSPCGLATYDMQFEMSIYLRLLAVYVSLLAPKGQANIGVLYHIIKQ